MRWQLSQHDDLAVVATEHAELFDAIARRQAELAAIRQDIADFEALSLLVRPAPPEPVVH